MDSIHWTIWVLLWLVLSETIARFCLYAYEKKRGRHMKGWRKTYLSLVAFWPIWFLLYFIGRIHHD